ncbi:TPA: hypothetical protein ACH3X1_012697 [Trebouxia sp. C0004]
MVNFGMFHLLDRTKTVGFDTAMTYLLQQPWVVFSCQTQTASDKQVRVSTLQFATAAGEVYIFDCLALGTQAIHEHGLAWLLQSPTVKKIMYSSNNTAAALWRQLKIQIDGAVNLQVLTAMPHQWPALPPSFDRSIADAISQCDTQATPLPATAPLPMYKSPMQLSTQSQTYPDSSSQHAARKDVCHVRADASSQKSGRRGHESPQAVLDLILDDLESDALSSPDDIVYRFSRDSPSMRKSDISCPPRQARGRCSSIGSMSLLDSMQLMEVPILPEEDGSVADEYVDNKLDEGERFNWLQRPLSSDALDYAAAEAKTTLRLYQQVTKDSNAAASVVDTQSSIQVPSDVCGPASPYKQQQAERRKLLSEGSIGKACPVPVASRQAAGSSTSGSKASAKHKTNKIPSWRMPCLS